MNASIVKRCSTLHRRPAHLPSGGCARKTGAPNFKPSARFKIRFKSQSEKQDRGSIRWSARTMRHLDTSAEQCDGSPLSEELLSGFRAGDADGRTSMEEDHASHTCARQAGRSVRAKRERHTECLLGEVPLARSRNSENLLEEATSIELSVLSATQKQAKEALLLFQLSWSLASYLGLGIRWTLRLIRLCLFAIFLMPGFAQMIVFYFFSPRVSRSVVYGPKPRNRLDIYLPRNHQGGEDGPGEPLPVVIFITGGAWTIGYKAWGSLLARRLSRYGVIVCCLDYRNFPQGNVEDMLEDCNTGVAWVLRHIGSRGGDPSQIYMVGQSAGGQLGALLLIAQAENCVLGGRSPALGGQPAWDPAAVKAFIGVSGAYDVHALADHLDRRGLNKAMFSRIMSVDGKPALKTLSPLYAFQNGHAGIWRHLPRMLLLHGTNDNSVPCEIAVEFGACLKAGGVDADVKLYVGKTHTQALIEDPMRGGRDILTDEILSVVTGKEHFNRQFPMCPAFLVKMASAVCPF